MWYNSIIRRRWNREPGSLEEAEGACPWSCVLSGSLPVYHFLCYREHIIPFWIHPGWGYHGPTVWTFLPSAGTHRLALSQRDCFVCILPAMLSRLSISHLMWRLLSLTSSSQSGVVSSCNFNFIPLMINEIEYLLIFNVLVWTPPLVKQMQKPFVHLSLSLSVCISA